jgi:hypothetical protein
LGKNEKASVLIVQGGSRPGKWDVLGWVEFLWAMLDEEYADIIEWQANNDNKTGMGLDRRPLRRILC